MHSNASTQDQTRLKAWTRVLSASNMPKVIGGATVVAFTVTPSSRPRGNVAES
jgi:hypothetical protein